MCDLSISHNSQRRRDELDLRGGSDRSPFCRDTCWESWLRGSEAELRDSRKGWHREAGRQVLDPADWPLSAPSPPFPPPLKRPRAPDRWEEGRKPWLWTRDRAHAAVQTGDLLGRVI